MQPDDLDAVADVVAQAMQDALAPVLERLAVVEASLANLTGEGEVLMALRERVAVVEAKAVQPATPDPLLDSRISAVDARLTPVVERVAATEARLQTLGDLRDRVVVLETHAAAAVPPVDLGEVRDRLASVELRTPTREYWDGLRGTIADLRAQVAVLDKTGAQDATRIEGYTAALQRDAAALGERVAALEARPLLPGPPGQDGAPGRDGADGTAGAAGLSFEGVYQEGGAYAKGQLVTWAGSSWHCNEPTTTKPGDGSKDWTLMVKRGRDGRDGKDAPGALPVVKVGGS